MKIKNQKIFEGRNVYSHKKCIRLDVDLCGYSDIPSKDIKGFNEGLLKMLPELKTHRCGIDEEGGFVKRLKEGTYLSHICEHIIIAIQNKLGIDVSYGKSREIKGDFYYIIFQYEYKAVGIESARLSIDIINSLISGIKFDFYKRMKLLTEILNNEIIGPSTLAIKNAALRYNLPVFEIGDSGFYQIGYGKQGRMIEATIGANTSCISTDIASDKMLTKELLIQQNIPVADGAKIYNAISLLKEGERIGYPLVIKPRFGSKGNGVALNLKSDKELIKAYNYLKDIHNELMIERYIEGNDYRVCVVNYNVVAVSLRIPPFIIGDGKNNIKNLIRMLNSDSKRGYDHEKPLTKIKIDESLLKFLEKQNMNLLTIPEKGEKIKLRENANLSTGGIAIDCTDKISEENKKICIRAAQTIGLDICGIDIKTTDIEKSLHENGVIMEINAAPGIRMHHYPTEGKVRDVGEAILKLQYNGFPHNIPVVSITGTNGKTTTTRLISHVLKSMGYTVGMTSTEGTYIDGECIQTGDNSGYYSAKTVLLNKNVEVAVLETARGGIIRNGLAYDLADVAVITNITEDHIGIDGIEDMNELSKVKALVGEAVKKDGYVIINADDEWSIKILDRIKNEKIFFSMNNENELIKKAINEGKIAIYVKDNYLYANNNKREYKIIGIKNIPITLDGVLEFNIQNVMAACGALIGMGIDYCMIAKGFKTFKLNENYNLGRFNIYDLNGIKVILDYGHNIEGYRAVLKCLKKIKDKRVIGVIGIPGDRKDNMALSVGKLCGKYIDKIYIKEDRDKRGRKKEEMARLLEKGVLLSGEKKFYKIILDEKEALKEALKTSLKGDIIVVFYEELQPLIDVINEYKIEAIKDNLASI
ncbi:MAG: cyanophycin synthetase [Clostridium sp.]|nr:cyanophycin synthetase [Clostridium sp.]